MNKKQLNSVIVTLIIIGATFVYWKVAVPKIKAPNPTNINDASNQIDKPSDKSDSSGKTKSGSFYGSSEFASFFENVPCKESYLIFNYLSDLINENKKKSETLLDMASKLAEAGQFDKALQVANMIDVDAEDKKDKDSSSPKNLNFGDGGKALMKALSQGNDEEISKLLENALSGGKDQKNEAYQKISEEMAKAGEIDQALKVANSIDKSNSNYKIAMEHIFHYMIENGEYDRVLDIAESIGDKENSKSKTIDDISKYINFTASREYVDYLIKRDDYDEALRQANNINDWRSKLASLTDLAKSLMKADQKDKGKKVFQSAIDILNQDFGADFKTPDKAVSNVVGFDIVNSAIFDKSFYFNTIATELALAGEMDWSKKIFERSLNLVKDVDKENKWSRTTVKSILTSGHYEWGIAEADKYKDKGSIFLECALTLSKMGKNEYADILFQKAKELWDANKKDSPQDAKDKTNRDYSDFLAYTGRFDWALNVANSIVSKEEKDWALSVIADSMVDSDQIEKALSVIDTIESDKMKLDTLKDILTTITKNKNYDWYDKILSKMLDYANSQADPKLRNGAFLTISKILMDLPCSDQEKFIQQLVTAFDTK